MELKVAGQTLSGDFSFEKEANGDVRGAVTGGALKIKSGDKELIDLSQISGGFEMSSEGVLWSAPSGRFNVYGTE